MKKIFTANELRIILFILGAVMLSVVIKAVGLKSINKASEESDVASMNMKQIIADTARTRVAVNRNALETDLVDDTKRDILIDINAADKDGLCKLPGVGEATALRIIEYRKSEGNFTNINDLLNVNGIGIKKFDKLKDMITTGEVNGKTETE